MRQLAIHAAVVLITLCAGSASATEMGFVEVSQIMFEPNEGFHIYAVTYAANLGDLDPGLEIRMMSYPNCVLWADRPNLAASDQNRNVMSVLGVRTVVEERWGGRGWRLVAASGSDYVLDTLRVEVHFETAREAFQKGGRASREFRTSTNDFADVVLKCALANAARSRPRVLNVAMTFIGAPELKRLNRVYPVPRS